jgi:hypothetical protein
MRFPSTRASDVDKMHRFALTTVNSRLHNGRKTCLNKLLPMHVSCYFKVPSATT